MQYPAAGPLFDARKGPPHSSPISGRLEYPRCTGTVSLGRFYREALADEVLRSNYYFLGRRGGTSRLHPGLW